MKKILVMKLRHHGDVLLSTALYKALVEQFPGMQVDALIYKETTPLLQNNPHLNNVLCIDRKLKGWARVKAELGLIRRVRQTRYDAVIHLTDQWIGALIAGFSRAPMRVEMEYAKRDKALWHACFTHRITPPPRGQAHAVELNLLCLTALGVDPAKVAGEMVLVPGPAELQKAQSLLDSAGIRGRFVLIHPAARWPFKCWDDDKFADVVAHLMNRGVHVVLTCSPDPVELRMTQHIERLARDRITHETTVMVNWGGQMSLPLLAALLKLAAYYVGVDSAPMHMAAALKKPQVALFGPSWVNEWRPWSDVATVIWAGDYGPLPHPDSINTDDPTRLLSAIPTQVVVDAVDQMMTDTEVPSANTPS
ncbi:putative lipopolysaccharide heptosyltransferase III [Limnobacter humi]|uniref:Lipopolysaccharide heptosyltransferase III n=1 Tax=Limnobacter humi TaxID=1778671 RepID=A0ABT1WC97_9BURK|nr:putative lipopolysaccharide heptosyltransferase III [Limnobacter humi]